MTKNEERINKLFKELVPETGKANSLAGELIRAMSRIAYRFYNDGDQVGMGYGKETCNPAARFLMAKGNKRVSSLATAIWGIYDESAYEDLLDILAGAVADHVEQTPSPLHPKSPHPVPSRPEIPFPPFRTSAPPPHFRAVWTGEVGRGQQKSSLTPSLIIQS